MRDIKEEHTRVLVLSAFLRAKDKIDNESEVSSPVTDVSALCADGGVLGVPRFLSSVFWASKARLFRWCLAH